MTVHSEHDEKEATGRSKQLSTEQISEECSSCRVTEEGAEGLAADVRRWQGANETPAGSRSALKQHGQTCRQTAAGGESEESRTTPRFLSRGAGYVAVPPTEVGRSRLGWKSAFSARCAVCDAH